MILSNGLLEYLLTAGISASFVLFLSMLVLCFSDIKSVLKEIGIKKYHIALLICLLIIFLLLEAFLVKPTQYLYFDDAIYQAMAQDLLHTGQAWMCNYGTPYKCFIGQLFHEPMGEAFNLAMGFGLFGVKLSVAYDVQIVIASISIIMVFLIYLLLFGDPKGALLSSMFMALSPLLLMWARPVTSDLAFMSYSLIAIFAMLLFHKRRNWKTFSLMLFALSMVLYMKVNAAIYILLIPLIFLILEDKWIIKSLKTSMKRIDSIDFRMILFFVIFLILITPEGIYTFANLHSDYGYMGSNVQKSCNTNGYSNIIASSNINLANLKANICSNIYFWFDYYKSSEVMQPLIFTVFGMLGVVLLFIYSRRKAIALSLWFVVPFILYTSFYAGSVTYGVDWRFMLSTIAQASIFAGFAAAFFINASREIIGRSGEGNKKSRIGTARIIKCIIIIIIIALVAYSIYGLLPQLGINPYKLQASDARFYENFVYTNSSKIPNSCIVLSYDPTLFNINNKSSAQLFYAYNSTEYENFEKNYSCIVIDWGYWCYTPNNLCANLNGTFNLSPIAVSTYSQGKSYGLYIAKLKKN